jgi:hypothetical protein
MEFIKVREGNTKGSMVGSDELWRQKECASLL